jgi:hypothetical protein
MNNSSEPQAQRLLHLIEKQEALRRHQARKSAIAAMVAASLGLAMTLSQLLSETRIKRPDLSQRDLDALHSDLKTIKAQVSRIDKEVNSMSTPWLSGSASAQESRLALAIKATDNRLKRVESAILESPESALAIPLLRKDINDSLRRADEYRAVAKTEIDRLYEQQKWMLSGIGAFLLSIIGGAATIIFRTAPNSKNNEA